MSELKTMSFELNQNQLDAAIATAMPALISGLAIDYTSGRPPKGVTADVTLSEAQIREAVIAHTKKLVNPSFIHFSVTFRATRGEDGLMTQITASSDPITPETEQPAASLNFQPTPAPTPTATETVQETAPVAQETVEETVTEEAPFEADTAVETAAEASTEVQTEAVAEEVTTADVKTEEVTDEAKPAGRSRLFADLNRPTN